MGKNSYQAAFLILSPRKNTIFTPIYQIFPILIIKGLSISRKTFEKGMPFVVHISINSRLHHGIYHSRNTRPASHGCGHL